jgi:hypothetical protein
MVEHTAVCRTKARTPFLSERSISTSTVPPNITLKYASTNNFTTTTPEHKVRGSNFRSSVELQVSNYFCVVKMPQWLSVAITARIEDALRDLTIKITDRYIRQLAVNYNTSWQTIYRYKSWIKAGSIVLSRSGGPRRVITWKMEQAIKLLLDERPWFYQDKIADFLLEAFDITVH